MFYDSELHFLQSVLKKCRVQTQLINVNEHPESNLDLGLRALLQIEDAFEKPLIEVLGEVLPNTIHLLTDGYECKYIYLQLPGDVLENVLVIGPYQIKSFNHEEILELAEKNVVPVAKMRDFESFYNGLPVVGDEGQLISLVDTFGEFIWNGSSNYQFAEYELETSFENVTSIINKSLSEHDGLTWNSKLIEARYAYENEFLFAVTQGNYPKAKHLISQVGSIQFDQRNTDPIRDMKNYCIIINTLFRKSVERGGVHPIHIDSVSSEFAKKIELRSSVEDIQKLVYEMVKVYCQLVNKYSVKDYSPTVQKVIVMIESNLASDLTLSELANTLNINASYLSTVFKKETGKTITGYVNEKRIELAQELLKTTNLQVQTIAQYCGIIDVHYFTRLFKKLTGVSPKQFREENNR
ncbi:MAG: AraC family transcriptional regulator [Ruminococcaceae bacterium]|nr:AraC family transcriptional regulator [Oscillospiraceae bacterium]